MIDKIVQLATSECSDNHELAIQIIKGQRIKPSDVIDEAIKMFAYKVFSYAVNKHLKDRRKKVFTLNLFGKETRFKVGIEVVEAQTKWFGGIHFRYHSNKSIYWLMRPNCNLYLKYSWIIEVLEKKKKLLLGTSNTWA